MRRSTREALMRALRSLSVLGPVGRFGPPQPFREVSMSMPMFDGNPAATAALRKATAYVDSSLNWFQSIQVEGRVLLSTVMYGSVSAEVLAVLVTKPTTLFTVEPEAVAAVRIMFTVGTRFVSQPSHPWCPAST